MIHYRKNLKIRARKLRKNMTWEERHLWFDFLKELPIRFFRQKPVGDYVLDFYCPKLRLAIDLDGGQHYEPVGLDYDARRTENLEKLGIRVVRYSNRDIHEHFTAVCENILAILAEQAANA